MTVKSAVIAICSVLAAVIVSVIIIFLNINTINEKLSVSETQSNEASQVSEIPTPEPEIQIQTEYKYIVIREIAPFQGQLIENTNMTKDPFESSEVISELPTGTQITVSTVTDNYYGVTTSDGVSGYVPINVIAAIPTPESTPIPEPTQPPEPTAVPPQVQ